MKQEPRFDVPEPVALVTEVNELILECAEEAMEAAVAELKGISKQLDYRTRAYDLYCERCSDRGAQGLSKGAFNERLHVMGKSTSKWRPRLLEVRQRVDAKMTARFAKGQKRAREVKVE